MFGYTSPEIALSGAQITDRFFKIGGFGNSFANFNVNVFGYIAYVYLPLLLLPLYKFHDDTSYSFRKMQLTFAYLLLFVGALMFQSLIFGSGSLGNHFQHFLMPYIGVFGVVCIAILFVVLSLLLIMEKSAALILHYFRETLAMVAKSLSKIFKKAFQKLKASYTDLSLDYTLRNKRKMINEELSEVETVAKNKYIFNEPLIESPLDEYSRINSNSGLSEFNLKESEETFISQDGVSASNLSLIHI